jgi:chromatin structure-remodeling complex subunit RSC4
MSKRVHGASDVEGSRTKRHRGTTGTSSDIDITLSDPIVSGGETSEQGGTGMQDVVKEEGLRLWQTVRDAVNKEYVASCLIRLFCRFSAWTIIHLDFRGRTLSLDFLRKPSKRLYPDYYKLIQHPIALEEIKKKLEHGAYSSLEVVKSDFELCFHNAKQYNMKDSDIWKDAKDLLVGISFPEFEMRTSLLLRSF